MYTYQVCIQHSTSHALDVVHIPGCMQTIFSMIRMHIKFIFKFHLLFYVSVSPSLQHPLDRSHTILNINRTYSLENTLTYVQTMYVYNLK